MKDKKFIKLTPFKMQVLQSFPFIDEDFDAITNYELLCKVVEYLNKTVENVDLLNEKVEEFEHYFDNLDVQEEINNKLDEMAEDGTLQEIITSYLNSKAIFGYDTVESMKEATNLINGSYAKTLGYHTKNDNGSALYKIRTITNEDIVDEKTIIALYDESLIAELITNDILYPEQLGAKGDGTSDDTASLNKCFELCQDNFKVILTKKYGITNTVFLPRAKNYIIDGGYIKALTEDGILSFSSTPITGENYYSSMNSTINNLIFDGQYIANGLQLGRTLHMVIENCKFINFKDYGLQTGSSESHDNIISKCYFIGRDYNHDEVNSIGIIINRPDSIIENCIFAYSKFGIKSETATSMINNCHFYCNDTSDGGNLWINSSIATVSNCNFDGAGIVIAGGNSRININNAIVMLSDRTRENAIIRYKADSNREMNANKFINIMIHDLRTNKTDIPLFSTNYIITNFKENVYSGHTLEHVIFNNPNNAFDFDFGYTTNILTQDQWEIANFNAQTQDITSHGVENISNYYSTIYLNGNYTSSTYSGSTSAYRLLLIPIYINGLHVGRVINALDSGSIRIYNSNYEFIGYNNVTALTKGKYFVGVYRDYNISVK